MHSSSQARNPIKLGHLKLTIPMESIYVKQRTVKHSNFFPAQDGNVSTLEEESFPYSMLMDFGPALSNESFGPPEQVQLDSSLNHMQRTRTQTREQLEAADNCRLVFSPPAGQSQPPVPPVSQAQPGHSSSEQGVPRSSPNTTNTSSGNTGSSPVQPRPVIGDIVVDLNVEQAPLGASEQRQLPPSTQFHLQVHSQDLSNRYPRKWRTASQLKQALTRTQHHKARVSQLDSRLLLSI